LGFGKREEDKRLLESRKNKIKNKIKIQNAREMRKFETKTKKNQRI